MSNTDGPAKLYELADHAAFDTELKRILTGKRLHDLADQWKAEREQAAADRAEIANCLENIRELAAQKRTSDAVIADVREELHIGPGISVVEEAGRVYAALAQAQHANDAERGEWSEYYALLTGDRGAWSPDDMRRAVKAQTDALAQARDILAAFEREARERIAAPDTNAAQMVVSEAVAETCRRISAALSDGAR